MIELLASICPDVASAELVCSAIERMVLQNGGTVPTESQLVDCALESLSQRAGAFQLSRPVPLLSNSERIEGWSAACNVQLSSLLPPSLLPQRLLSVVQNLIDADRISLRFAACFAHLSIHHPLSSISGWRHWVDDSDMSFGDELSTPPFDSDISALSSVASACLDLSSDKLRGLLISGPSGCGKTELCKGISRFLQLPTIVLRPHQLLDAYQGGSERNLRSALDSVRQFPPPPQTFLNRSSSMISSGDSICALCHRDRTT